MKKYQVQLLVYLLVLCHLIYAQNDSPSLSQTIRFDPLPRKLVTDKEFAARASATSGLTVSYSSSNTQVASIVNDSLIRITAVGTTTITAFQEGDSTFSAATPVSHLLYVDKATALVTVQNLTQTYDGTIKTISAITTPQNLNVQLTFSQNGIAVQPKNAGIYTVVATINDTNYTGSTKDSLIIKQAQASIKLSNLSQIYDGTIKTVPFTTSPTHLMVDLLIKHNAQVQEPINAGTYTVSATIKDDNYTGVLLDTLIIEKATAAITIGNLNHVYDGKTKTVLVATTPTNLNVQVSFTQNSIAKQPINAGVYAVAGTILHENYKGSANASLTINKASGTISLTSLIQVADGTKKTIPYSTIPENLLVEFTFTQNGDKKTPISPGIYVCKANIVDSNYAGSKKDTLIIREAAASILFNNLRQAYDGFFKPVLTTTIPKDLPVQVAYTQNGISAEPIKPGKYLVQAIVNTNKYFGSAVDTLIISKGIAKVSITDTIFTYNGIIRPITVKTIPSGLTVKISNTGTTTAPLIKNAGSYTVTASVNDSNYQGSTTSIITIKKVILTISTENKIKEFGQPNPPFNLEYSGFISGENTYALSVPAVIQTNAQQNSPVGIYPIDISGAQAHNYEIIYVSGKLLIKQTSQQITFLPIPSKTISAADFDPGATSSSGLRITYTSSNTRVAAIINNLVHIIGAGTSIITALQAGDSNVAAAQIKVQLLTVHPYTKINTKNNTEYTVSKIKTFPSVVKENTNYLSFFISNPTVVRDLRLVIYDACGGKVYQRYRTGCDGLITTEAFRYVNTGQLPSGTYYAEIHCHDAFHLKKIFRTTFGVKKE